MLNKNIKAKLYSYLKLVLRMRDYRRGWMKGDCPYCGKHDKFGVNLYQDRCNCFYCGPKPKPFYMVMELEKTDKRGIFKILDSQEELNYFERSFQEIESVNEINLELPEGFKLLSLGDSQLAKSARAYVRSRGFNPNEMALKGWGYGTHGKYWGYLIMPIYYQGKLVYYTSRRFLGNGPKFMNLEQEEGGVGKSMIIYNHEALFIYDRIRIVESIMNAETLGENAIATNGKKLSSFQLNQIWKSPATHFTILLDNDAWDDAIILALELSTFKKVKLVYFPDSQDVNDLGKKETNKLIYKHKYLNYHQILSLKYERSFITYIGK